MSSNSTDEDEPIVPFLFDETKEDYLETCGHEVNDIVPRFERLCINDNEPMYLPSDNMNMPGSSMNTVPSSINNFEGASIANSNEKVSPIFVSDISCDDICINEATKPAVGSIISLFGIEEFSQFFSKRRQVDIQSQDVIQKASSDGEIHMHPIDAKNEQILYKPEETGAESICDESPLDLPPKRNLDHNNEAEWSSAISENKTELQSLMVIPEKMKHVDSETGEITENSSIILPDTPGSNSIGKELDQFADEMASGIVFDLDPSKLSYSADVSSDDQSHSSSGIMLDSPSDIGAVNAAPVEDERFRKITALFPPVSEMLDITRRHYSIFHPLFSIIDVSKKNFSSDEDYKNSSAIGKDSPINSGCKCKKTVKSSPRPIDLNHLDVKKERKRPSPCKREKTSSENITETTGKFCKRSVSEHNSETGEKTHLDVKKDGKRRPSKRGKTSSENITETTGKFCKRSVSEHNSETGEKTHLVIRSTSLSPGLKNIHSISVTNPPTESSTISQSRKRTNPSSHNANRVKYRRSSSSSDDAENK